MRNRWLPWLAAIMLWSTLGVLFALPGLSSGNWSRVLLGSLAQWWSWGLITPLIFWTDSRLPFKEKQLGMRILAHLFASAPLTLLDFYVAIAVHVLLGLAKWSALAHPLSLLYVNAFSLLWSWVVYWVIFGVIQTFRYYEHYRASELRLERMEHSFSQARLNALRMQLDPHFLFIGFLGKDPEKRQVRGNGASFAVLSVATQQSWKDSNDEWQSKTEWHRVVAFNRLGESLADVLHKGDHVLVDGQLVSSKYERENGKSKKAKASKVDIFWSVRANSIRLLSRAESEAPAQPSAPEATPD
jgi:single stranded DNA-binding protein